MQKIIWTEPGSWADFIAFSCPKTLKTLDAQKKFFPLPTFSQQPNTLLLLILNALPSLPGISSPYQWKPNRLNPPFAAFPSLSPPSLSKNPKKKKRNPLFFSLSTNIFSQISSLSLSQAALDLASMDYIRIYDLLGAQFSTPHPTHSPTIAIFSHVAKS